MTRGLIPAELPIHALTYLVDSREDLAYDFAPYRSRLATLSTGDYSALGFETEIAIERKSLSDLLGCIAGERARFERELQRMLAYPTRCVVVEASWSDLDGGNWRSRLTPQSATGSVLAFIGSGVPFLFAGDRENAQKATGRLIYLAARRRYRPLRAIVQAAELVEGAA